MFPEGISLFLLSTSIHFCLYEFPRPSEAVGDSPQLRNGWRNQRIHFRIALKLYASSSSLGIKIAKESNRNLSQFSRFITFFAGTCLSVCLCLFLRSFPVILSSLMFKKWVSPAYVEELEEEKGKNKGWANPFIIFRACVCVSSSYCNEKYIYQRSFILRAVFPFQIKSWEAGSRLDPQIAPQRHRIGVLLGGINMAVRKNTGRWAENT